MNLVDGTLRLSDSCSNIRRIQSALKKEMHQQIACIYRLCVLPKRICADGISVSSDTMRRMVLKISLLLIVSLFIGHVCPVFFSCV